MLPRSQLTGNVALSPDERGARRARDSGRAAAGASPAALLFATAPAADGGPAAALDVLGTTLLGRLLGQLAALGVRRAWVVTRPDWSAAVERAAAVEELEVSVVASEGLGDDLRLAAELATGAGGTLVVGSAHVLTHREALAGLFADPRIVSGVLASGSRPRTPWSFPIRSLRGHVVSAASPYHRVERENGYFLGFMKVDARDRDRLVAACSELAGLAADPPGGWEGELERKEGEWRLAAWREAVERERGAPPDPGDLPDAASLQLDAAGEERVALRRRLAAGDPVPLLLVGLVRGEAELTPSNVRDFFFAAPLSREAARAAAEEVARSDERRVLLDSAVKASDGFFTTFFVSPYSKYLARFAARLGWTPNTVTALSFAVGVAAAASFALGSRASLIAGALLLQVSFTIDCVDGQLARYTRAFTKLGAWLDSVFDRTKEYLVYAGLAVGSARGFDDDVWLLAAAALTLQTVRHMSDFAYVASQRRAVAPARGAPLEDPGDPVHVDVVDPEEPAIAPPAVPTAHPSLARRLAWRAFRLQRRWGLLRWGNRIVRLPIGERFALISVTAALATPRVTFLALLAWGGVAAVYALTVRTLMSYGRARRLMRAVLR